MLENVNVNSIHIDKMGGFRGSKLNKHELEYILSHIVYMSKQKGEWVTEFTLVEFFREFKPAPTMFWPEEFPAYFKQLLDEGYLETGENTHSYKVTEKFAELCEEYSRQ